MNTAVLTKGWDLDAFAESSLKAATRFWFAIMVAGQLVFAFTVAAFYGGAAARGDFQAWNRVLMHGVEPGNLTGNFFLTLHLMFAALIMAAGALQLVPQIRARAPAFHRWNGRVYIVAAFAMGISGLYLLFSGRIVIGDLSQHIGLGLDAVLIIACAALALRYALLRDFKSHRRWALRLFVVVGSALFFRAGLILSFMVFQGPFGFDPKTFEGPFITFLAFAQFLVPLAVLEIYLRTQEQAQAGGRLAMAAGLSLLTLALGAGIVGTTMGMWLPKMKSAFDTRISIASTLSATIESGGIDAAGRQYRELKAANPANYNFDENELNNLGYRFLRFNKFKEAIGIFELNVEAYPQSGNAYDSLAEAYMDAGNKAQAIANYRKSLELDPKNRNAAGTLEKLEGPNVRTEQHWNFLSRHKFVAA